MRENWIVCVLACVSLVGCGTDTDTEPTDTSVEISDSLIQADLPPATDSSQPDVGPDVAPDVTPDASPSQDSADPADDLFSFFVTSIESMQELSGSIDGFGGDLGGLEGADGICQTIAGKVDGGHKTWRAFLSVTAGPDGSPVHAKDRIGQGPWYDRNGRLIAANLDDLLADRPAGDAQSAADLPNEYGQGQKQYGDNHDVLTGTNEKGQLNDADPVATCLDWTSSVGPGSEKRVMGGHSWPREPKGDDDVIKLPPPLLDACDGLEVGADCKVTGKKTFESTCVAHPYDESLIYCAPPNGNVPGAGNGGTNWIASHTVPGCAPGVQLEQVGGGQETDTVGGGGGYGGLYCFALEP